MRVLVTGATGNVGSEVVSSLEAAGIEHRIGVRNPDAFRARTKNGGVADVVRFDFQDARTYAPAAEGCTALFLVRPPAIADVQNNLNPFVDVAREQGVEHVVFLSVIGAGDNSIIPHHKVEKHLESQSAPYTFLRAGFFAQNFEDAYRPDIVEDDRIYVPAKQAEVAFIDVRDLASVATLAFSEGEPHFGQAYRLTGPEPITFSRAAEVLSEVLDRSIRYEPASILGYVRHLKRRGLPWGAVIVQTILHADLRRGTAADVDPTLERLLGRPGFDFARYATDHADRWAPATATATE